MDLVTRSVSWAIFYAMPRYIKYKVITAALTCTPPEEIMAPAVADDHLYGYLRLYQTLLDSSKEEWARALRVLTHHNHLPALVHCIHGKDRTGLLIMLVALLCGVDPERVIEDYIVSELMLKEGREDGTLGLPPHLSNDQVIGAKRSVMEQTISYLEQNYGGAEGYATNIGLTSHEIALLRVGLMSQPPQADLEALGLVAPDASPCAQGCAGSCTCASNTADAHEVHPPRPMSALRRLTLDPRKVVRFAP